MNSNIIINTSKIINVADNLESAKGFFTFAGVKLEIGAAMSDDEFNEAFKALRDYEVFTVDTTPPEQGYTRIASRYKIKW